MKRFIVSDIGGCVEVDPNGKWLTREEVENAMHLFGFLPPEIGRIVDTLFDKGGLNLNIYTIAEAKRILNQGKTLAAIPIDGRIVTPKDFVEAISSASERLGTELRLVTVSDVMDELFKTEDEG
jgi:hypothetical protein